MALLTNPLELTRFCVYRDATTDASYDMHPVDDPMVDDRANSFCGPLELNLVMLGDSKMGQLPADLTSQIQIIRDHSEHRLPVSACEFPEGRSERPGAI